jgi:hypothetical protein
LQNFRSKNNIHKEIFEKYLCLISAIVIYDSAFKSKSFYIASQNCMFSNEKIPKTNFKNARHQGYVINAKTVFFE